MRIYGIKLIFLSIFRVYFWNTTTPRPFLLANELFPAEYITKHNNYSPVPQKEEKIPRHKGVAIKGHESYN